VAQARRALERGVPHGDRYLADGSVEIVSSREWYLKGGTFSGKRVMREWNRTLEEASARGYEGLRLNGDAAWLRRKIWRRFGEYEEALNESLARKRMIALCSYPLAACGAAEVLDVARPHRSAIAKRLGNWEVVAWRSPPTSPDPYDTLTTREREVLRLAAEGHRNSETARRLSVSVRTVESHRPSLLRKLGVRNQTELVQYAFWRGLLPLEHRRRQATDH
jgi:DNA-binding CsgD family transcriptional regulator